MQANVMLEAGERIMKLAALAFVSALLWPALSLAQQRPSPTAASDMALMKARYPVTQMERVLGGAAEYGAKIAQERLRSMIPADMLLSASVRVRGFRLDPYGYFFDVEMPPLEGTLPWVLQTLDQNNLGLDSAMRVLNTLVESAGSSDARQALQRVQLQISPLGVSPLSLNAAAQAMQNPAARTTGSAAALSLNAPPITPAVDPPVTNPQEAFRSEVKKALKDAMLEHSAALSLGDGEWLTVAARGNEDRPRLAPGDYESPIVHLSVKGSDLTAFQAKQITREEALGRIIEKVF
jgi:hypothetical protein